MTTFQQENFKKTKEIVKESPGENSFDFSEMYIFGKFNKFCRRLKKIVSMFNEIETFGKIRHVNVEGKTLIHCWMIKYGIHIFNT